MATTTINSNPQTLQAIKVEQSSTLSSVLPTIAAGEVLKVSVRSKQANGQGMIGLKGQLIKANLPGGVQGGDRLLAQVSKLDDAVVLKILSVQKPGSAAPITKVAPLAQSLQSLTQTPSGAPSLRTIRPFQLDGAPLQNLPQALTTAITDSDAALTQLQATTTGSLAESLRNSSETIKTLLAKSPATTEAARLVQALEAELGQLLNPSAANNIDAARALQTITQTIVKHVKDPKTKVTDEPETKLLKFVLKDLGQALSKPAEQAAMLESAMHRLQTFQSKTDNAQTAMDPKTRGELQNVALRLEQMASMQESLNELNPVMQALGEPALILFPSMFQGMLANSEVVVDPRGGRKNKGKKKEEDEDGKPPFERIQMRVPLPAFGEVDIDIAYREDEMLVRFVVDDESKESFLVERLEELRALLSEQGFLSTELNTQTGSPRDPTPGWSDILQAKTSLIA